MDLHTCTHTQTREREREREKGETNKKRITELSSHENTEQKPNGKIVICIMPNICHSEIT